MEVTRLRARRDLNHAEIREAFRRLGWIVWDTASMAHGAPDLVVARRGETILVEVKQPGAAFTEDEVWFQGMWPDRYETVRCLADVIRLTERG
jgi:hypothetical protein